MSEGLPEPTANPAFVGSQLRASDRDRDQVAAVLSTAYAEGRITKDEHDERLDAVLKAKTFADLLPLTSDLVALTPPPAPAPNSASEPATRPQTYAIEPSNNSEPNQMIAIFGGVSRKGRWRVPRLNNAFALFGGIELDFTEATFEGTEIEINGFWCFGGMDIKAPAGVEIRDRTAGIFGGTDIKGLGDPVPGAPVITIKGASLFGGVSVTGPLPKRRRSRHKTH